MNKKAIVIFLLLAVVSMAFVGNRDEEAQIDPTDTHAVFKAGFVFYVASQSDWPQERKTGDFTIAVLGNPNLYQELVMKYSSDPIGSQKLKVVNAKSIEELKGAHIACVSRENSEQLSKVVKYFKGSSTIIVSQLDGALEKGAHVNFVVIDNKLLYELNQQRALDCGVTFGNRLIQIAVNK